VVQACNCKVLEKYKLWLNCIEMILDKYVLDWKYIFDTVMNEMKIRS